jgi:transcription elongation factor Elf1
MGRTDQPQRWTETAKALSVKAAHSVDCPCCGENSLSARDVEYGFGHEKGVQRYISCGCCGAFTSVNVKRAGQTRRDVLMAAE